MSYVVVSVRVDTTPDSFTATASAARALVENILRRDPRFHTLGMEVVLRDETSTNGNLSYMVPPETAGDNLNNIFQNAKNRKDNI